MRIKKRVTELSIYVILGIFVFYWLFPLGMALLNSFKTNSELLTSIMSLPSSFSLDNYIRTFTRMNYFRSLFNTIFISVLSVVLIVFCSSLAGWKIQRTKTKLSKFLYGLFSMSMLIPFSSVMIPQFRLMQAMNLTNSLVGLSFVYVGLGVRMAIFLYSGFVKGVPLEIEESAAIDGANSFQTFFFIVFPLLKPITVTVTITNIVWIWNNFLLPLILISDSRQHTLLLSTSTLFGQYSNDWTAILSALVLTAIPIIIFYAFFQKTVIQGIGEGAIRG